MASVEANQMLAVAAAACDDKKAEDIRILALDPAESGLSDYFLICTGTNDRQTVAITDEIEIRLKREFGAYPNAVEGRRQGEWVLMDYVDFIVHVFLPEKRAFYGLERLRPSATTLSVADLNVEIKNAIRAERSSKKTMRIADSERAADEQDGAIRTRGAESQQDATEADSTEAESTGAESKGTGGSSAEAKKSAAKKGPAKKAGAKTATRSSGIGGKAAATTVAARETMVKKTPGKKSAVNSPSPRALAAGAAGSRKKSTAPSVKKTAGSPPKATTKASKKSAGSLTKATKTAAAKKRVRGAL